MKIENYEGTRFHARKADYIGTNDRDLQQISTYLPIGPEYDDGTEGRGALTWLADPYGLLRVEWPFTEWSYVLLIFKEAMP